MVPRCLCLTNGASIRAEIARLEANQLRNKKRASKKAATAGSPDGAASPEGDGTPASKQTQPTLRKCANCGQVGHIKTNKKSVPENPICDFCGMSMTSRSFSSASAFQPMSERKAAHRRRQRKPKAKPQPALDEDVDDADE